MTISIAHPSLSLPLPLSLSLLLNEMKVDDDYFPIVESAMDDSREALTRLCQQDPTVDSRMPPNNLNDSVS